MQQRVLSPDPDTQLDGVDAANAVEQPSGSPPPVQMKQRRQSNQTDGHSHSHGHSRNGDDDDESKERTEAAAAIGSWGDAISDEQRAVGTAMPLQCDGGDGSKEEPRCGWSGAAIGAYLSHWRAAASAYLRDRLSPRRIRRDWQPAHTHTALQAAYAAATLLLFVLLYHFNGFAASTAIGTPQELTCHHTAWSYGGCGINGADCQPFESDQWSAVRCPHRCTLLDTDGAVIGGRGGIYKADSYICAAAVHAGVVDDSTGGCFLYRPAGMRHFFRNGGRHGGILSVGFPSWFPGSITFAPAEGASMCTNYGVAILVVGIVWLLPLALMRPNALFLWLLLLCWGYWYAALTLNDRFNQRALFWRGTVDMWTLFVFGYVLYLVGPRHALFVDADYERRAWTEWPWKLCCRPGVRRWCSHAASRRVQSHAPHAHSSKIGGGEGGGGEGAASVSVSASSRSVGGGYPRITAPSSNQVLDSSSLRLSVTVSGTGPAPPTPVPATPGVGLSGDVSPLGSQRAAQLSASRNLAAPLMPLSPSGGDWAGASPSPSPSPMDSPPATSTLYHPPQYELDVRRRIAAATTGADSDGGNGNSTDAKATYASVATRTPGSLGTTPPSSTLAPALAPGSVPAPGSRVLRPWYELYLLLMVPLLLSLHFTYLAYIVPDIDLDAGFFSHGAGGAVFISVVLLLVLGVVAHAMRLGWRAGVLFRYLLYYLYAGLVVLVISLLFAGSASFHLHHVLAGMMLLPMSRFPSRISLVFQAVAAGIFVNGLAIWGMEPAWDVAPPPLGGPHWRSVDNPPPGVMQVANATSDSVYVAWPLPDRGSDAIGSSLALNGIEIYHSTWVDTTYGGGFTPVNSSAIAGAQKRGARTNLLRAATSAAAATATAADKMESAELHEESAHLLRSMAAFHHHPSWVRIELHDPSRAPAQLALPHVPRKGLGAGTTRAGNVGKRSNPRALTATKPLQSRSWAAWSKRRASATGDGGAQGAQEDDVSLLASALPWHDASSSALVSQSLSPSLPFSSLSSSPPPALRVGTMYQLFRLVNLYPNCTYLLQASHIQPGGWLLPGQPIIIRTKPN